MGNHSGMEEYFTVSGRIHHKENFTFIAVQQNEEEAEHRHEAGNNNDETTTTFC
jgi:hypothetical protein